MTTTLERPETAPSLDHPIEPEPPRPSRRRFFSLIAALALLGSGIAFSINAGGETGGLTNGQTAYGQRLEQMAAAYIPPELTPGQLAEANRLTQHAQSLGATLTPAQQAEADRWTARALAELDPTLTRGQRAAADRYSGIAEELTRGRRAEAARWQALANSYK